MPEVDNFAQAISENVWEVVPFHNLLVLTLFHDEK